MSLAVIIMLAGDKKTTVYY